MKRETKMFENHLFSNFKWDRKMRNLWDLGLRQNERQKFSENRSQVWWKDESQVWWRSERESFPKISNNIIFCLCFFFWEKLDNVVVDMEVGEGNLGTEKRSHLRVHKTHIIFHLNGWFSDFLFLGFENHIIYKCTSQNTFRFCFFHVAFDSYVCHIMTPLNL